MEATESDKRDVRRPMNAFLIFCKRHRSIVREKNPDLDNRSVTRILGDLWANLKEEEKTVYTDLAKQYKDAFMRANPDYKWHNPEKSLASAKGSPEGSKSVKTEINILPEGSITPGKLADPSNMGGLSLLLMAGEQSIRESVDDKHTKGNTSVPDENCQSTNPVDKKSPGSGVQPAVKPKYDTKVEMKSWKDVDMMPREVTNGGAIDKTETDMKHQADGEPAVKEQGKLENSLSNLMTLKNENSKVVNPTVEDIVTVSKPLLYQAVAAPKVSQKSLFTEAFSDKRDKTFYSEILRDNFTSTKVCNIENQKGILTDDFLDGRDKKAKPLYAQEKENISKCEMNEKTVCTENEESPMITCGKMVVNHIIDKLYSSEISVAARKAAGAGSESGRVAIESSVEQVQEKEEQDVGRSVSKSSPKNIEEELSQKTDLKEMTFDFVGNVESHSESNNNIAIKSYDEADGFPDVKTTRKRQMSQSSSKGNESNENEDLEELQPLRKSRRRNKGQRYQMLINDGIIQPSKERMAALQKNSPKHESMEEDVEPEQTYNSYILPETAVRRFRKRTTSESAKDKLIHPDDVKRYKTGDFDLEAQIATLPACAVENMGRKRGFARQRHNSESIHTSRKSSMESETVHVHPPVFDIEKTVSLPPHIKIPSPEQKSAEPVVGSRKRKARKHSITHMLPAPASVRQATGKGAGDQKNQPVAEGAGKEEGVLKTQDSDTGQEDKTSAFAPEIIPEVEKAERHLPQCGKTCESCDCERMETDNVESTKLNQRSAHGSENVSQGHGGGAGEECEKDDVAVVKETENMDAIGKAVTEMNSEVSKTIGSCDNIAVMNVQTKSLAQSTAGSAKSENQSNGMKQSNSVNVSAVSENMNKGDRELVG